VETVAGQQIRRGGEDPFPARRVADPPAFLRGQRDPPEM
jgi:hypothetical protein